MANREPGPFKFWTNWSKWCLWDKDLKHHIHNKHKRMMVTLFPRFTQSMRSIDLARLDDSGGIGKHLRKYEAQFPQNCRRMFNSNDNYAH